MLCSRVGLRLKPVGLERPDVDVRRPAGHQVGDDTARPGAAGQPDMLMAEGEEDVFKNRRAADHRQAVGQGRP